MSDEERFEKIRIALTFDSLNLCNAPRLKNFSWPYKQIHESDLAWLFEQVERVQELERKNKTLSNNHFQQLEQYRGLVERNKRLRETEDAQAELYRRLNAGFVKKCNENKRYREALVFAAEELTTILEVENLTKEQIAECAGSAYNKINEALEDSK